MGIDRIIRQLLGGVRGRDAEGAPSVASAGGFELARGVEVADLTGIEPAYSAAQTESGWWLQANVSAERILETFLDLARQIPKPGFLIVGVPTTREVEETLRASPADPCHRGHHYLGGLDDAGLEAILRAHEEHFVHDGLLTFGFASHAGGHKVLVQRYKIFSLMVPDPEPYAKVLVHHGHRPVPLLRTVWDTFSEAQPGVTTGVEVDGATLYDLVSTLEARGLVFGKRDVN
jgi:hypothetical protein